MDKEMIHRFPVLEDKEANMTWGAKPLGGSSFENFP